MGFQRGTYRQVLWLLKKRAKGDSEADGSEMKKRLPLIMLSSPQRRWMLREGENYSSWAKSFGPVLPPTHQPDHSFESPQEGGVFANLFSLAGAEMEWQCTV